MSKVRANFKAKELEKGESKIITEASSPNTMKLRRLKTVKEIDKIVEKQNEAQIKRETTIQTFDKAKFKYYKPFYSDYRKGSRMSLMVNLWYLARRIINLYAAMFLADYSWL